MRKHYKNNQSKPYTDGAGNTYWSKNNKLHRINGPAVEKADGTKEWYRNGKRHRIGGPAVISPTGLRAWFFNDLKHREDGPALIWADGETFFYVYDHHCKSINEYLERITDCEEEKVLLKLKLSGIKACVFANS